MTPSPSSLGRRCDKCNANHTTVDKRYVNNKSKGERWYKYYDPADNEVIGLECHNCYMKEWSKATGYKRKRKSKN